MEKKKIIKIIKEHGSEEDLQILEELDIDLDEECCKGDNEEGYCGEEHKPPRPPRPPHHKHRKHHRRRQFKVITKLFTSKEELVTFVNSIGEEGHKIDIFTLDKDLYKVEIIKTEE